MQTLNRYFHAIVFVMIFMLLLSLQFGPLSKGWPVPMAIWELSAIVNLPLWIFVLSLSMIPFGYDVERRFSIASLMQLTLATSLSFSVLRPSYLSNYYFVERLVIIFLTAMVLNGLLHWTRCCIENQVQLAQWRTRKRLDQELDGIE